jgi:TonB family protein
MVCVSCGRTGDPNRSFCTYCGSAVFVDAPLKSLRPSVVRARPSSTSVPDSRGLSTGTGARRAASFPLVGFIRLLIFGFILWWVGSALLAIPEVRLMWDQVQRGETVTPEPAVNRFKQAIGAPEPPASAPRSSTSRASETVAPRPAVPPTDEPVSASAPREAAPRDAEVTPSPLPRGVFLPGNGVTSPRAIERHLPSYTRQARLARIEGTVRLRGIVQPDGRINAIEVVKSLDQQFGLDRAAVSALEQWRFEPGVRNGQAVPVAVHVDLTFKLPE